MTPEKLEQLEQAVAARFPELPRERLADALILHVTTDNLLATLTALRDDPGLNFTQMMDLAGVHYPDRDKPLELVYQLLSVHKNHRLRVKMALDEGQSAPSVIGVWSCADWFEREAYEMFGIPFTGHPDLRRLLTGYDFDGHPLRKDFPVEGLTEVRYDKDQKRVVTVPIALKQKNREFYG